MSTTAPLQYESLKMVIQYLEPNLRFKLAKRLPSIRRTEKMVPLKLGSLAFSEMAMTINNTTYRLGIYLDHPDRTPLCHQICNDEGGFQHDLYQWGSDTDSGEDVILPGNLAMPDNRFQNEGPNFYERHLRIYQTVLAHKLEHGEQAVVLPEYGPIPQEWKELAIFVRSFPENDIAEIDLDVVERLESYFSTGTLQYNIHCFQTQLQLLHCQQNNIQLPCTPRIQLTVESPKGKQIYRYDYSMKLSTALKNIASRLLSGRRHVIDVKTFDTADCNLKDRFPIEFKVRTKNLKMRDIVENYEAFKHNIEESSQPMDSLSVCWLDLESARTLDLEILKNAKRLYVKRNYLAHEYSAIFIRFKNPVVQMNFTVPMSCQDQINFIRNWMQAGRPVGATFSYQVWTIDELFDQIREQLFGTIVCENTALLQMSSVAVTWRDSLDYFKNTIWTVQLQVIRNPNRLN